MANPYSYNDGAVPSGDQTGASIAAAERVLSGNAFRAAQAAFDATQGAPAPVEPTSPVGNDPTGGIIPTPDGPFGFSGQANVSTGASPSAGVAEPAQNFGITSTGGVSTTGGNWETGGGTTASGGASVTPYAFGNGYAVSGAGNGSFGNFTDGSIATGSDGLTAGGDSPLVVGGIRPSSTENGMAASGATPDSSPSSGLGDGNLSGSGSGAANPGQGVLANPLDPYAQVTYHFRFFTTGDNGQGDGITIAETGRTGFNIRDVTFESFVGPNDKTRSTVQQSLTMTIVEPMGTNFFDGLLLAANKSGTKNFQKSPYYLSLYFMGYTQDGQVVNPIQQGLPSGGQWRWRISLSDILTGLNEGGATYTIKAVILDTVALQEENLKIQEPIRVSGTTVGDVLNKIASAINASVKKNYQDQVITYAFKPMGYNGQPDPSSFKLIESTAVAKDPYRHRDMDEATRDDYALAYARGQNISEIAESLIGVTKQGHALATWGDANGGGGDPNALPTGQFRKSVFYRAYPQVTYGDYHEPTGNYKKTITYYIKPFATQSTQLHPQEASKNNEQQAVSAASAGTNKRYEYFFTGKNTSVLNFDVKFNTSWQSALPRFGGFNYFNDQVQVSAIYDKAAEDALKQYGRAPSPQQSGSQGTNSAGQSAATSAGGSNPIGSGLSSLTGTLGQAGGLAQSVLSLTGIGGPGAAGAVGSALGQVQQFGSIASQVGSGNFLGAASGLANALGGRGGFGGGFGGAGFGASGFGGASGSGGGFGGGTSGTVNGQFVEDMLAQSDTAAGPFTVSFAQNAEGVRRAAGSGVAGPHGSRGRSVYGSLLDQMYSSSALQDVDITIRGDPYWLGGQQDAIFGSSPPQNAPDITAGDVCFVVVFKYPVGVNERDGTVQFRTQDSFTGLYRATSVQSTFSADGNFTQVLKGYRLNKVGSDAAAAIGANSRSSGSSPVTGAANSGSSIPQQNTITVTGK